MVWCVAGSEASLQSSSAVAGLSVDDVADCLRRLHLDAFVESFRQHAVDGDLLSHIDEQMLVSDFAMTRFEAKKLVMFVMHGWRPTHAS